jgi:tRNA nucleotidyltransferase (CCA-adding enzyme)
MDLILCHTTADFDALGAAVGLTRLLPGSKIVLTGGAHPPVRDFLALYKDEYSLIERRSVNPKEIRCLTVVDTQLRDRLGKASEWFDLPQLQEVIVYDHHQQLSDIPATQLYISDVGAVTTLIVEELEKLNITLTPPEATVMALGIHVDTGSLTYDHSSARDALALAYLMKNGANLSVINEYLEPGLSPQMQQILTQALDNLQSINIRGYIISWVILKTNAFVPGLSSIASHLRSLTVANIILLANEYPIANSQEYRLVIIGRSQLKSINLNDLFQPLGGGGHPQAASLSLRGVNSQTTINQLIYNLTPEIPYPPTARDLMSSPVRTIRPETTIAEAQRILLRYGHSGLSVVERTGKLVGIISRRDLDIALHHGFSHAPVKGYMTTKIKTISPETTLPEIEELMVTYDIGRLPVIENNNLTGIVTRTDVLRELHSATNPSLNPEEKSQQQLTTQPFTLTNQLRSRLNPPLRELLTKASQEAEKRGWHLYLVGGAVRDLLLADQKSGNLMIKDIDLVVDGFYNSADSGAGVELATEIQQMYPTAKLEIHGAFQTAALVWHKDNELDSLALDIATARTEFYPYPAANPEVEASSIRQDLYRRDFTINAMALRLTSSRGLSNGLSNLASPSSPLLDYFGGLLDLQAKQIRVLHANSFIEDPTRIFRGVRFAVRLGFQIETETEAYIRYAINSGVYDRTAQENSKVPALQTRLKVELKYILEAPYWKEALKLLDNLGALRCIHPTLKLNEALVGQLRLLQRCLTRFDQQQSYLHWQMRLEALIANISPEYRVKVAKNLQLSDDSIKRLEKLHQAFADIQQNISPNQTVSRTVKILGQYDDATLILIAIKYRYLSDHKYDNKLIRLGDRRLIWKYLTVWRHVQPILNGNDLKKLGYKPGPNFRLILDDLLAANLDGVITDKASGERFLKTRYRE